jgi:glycosyltransferase involved in cell wall biosynthesis
MSKTGNPAETDVILNRSMNGLKGEFVQSAAPRRAIGVKPTLRAILRLLGKTGSKKAAVIGSDPASCHRLVLHIRRGAPDVPVWLFSTRPPFDETASLCERVVVRRGHLALLYQAQRQLWRCSVALSAGSWTGERGVVLKLAPLLIPPFRSVFLNDAGDFLCCTPSNVIRHGRHRLRETVHSGWRLLTHDLWRTGPCTRITDVACGLAHSGPCTRIKDVTCGIAHSGPCTRTRDVASATTLLAASVILRLSGYPDRRLFHCLHGDQRLSVPNPDPTGSGVEWFNPVGTQWDPAAFERFARSASSRWIGWSAHPRTSAAVDMSSVPAGPDSFAWSLQSSFRQWRPMLFATAPFRALQPGEASQVLAPLSETIVVDRRKLLALGVPKCRMASTAWLLLFWKAAAAGWRSYSIGSAQAIGQEHDFPQHERAFILRVLANAALRRLGPSEPGLSRGSIAFHPDPVRTARPHSTHRRGDRLKVLVVSPFLPYPLSHGGAVRMFNLCRALAHRVDFSLVARHEQGEAIQYARLHEVFQEVRIVDIDEPASRDRRLPAQVRQHRSHSLTAAIRSLSAEWEPDLLQVEYTHMADFRNAAPEVPAILVEHDLTFSLYRQLAERHGAGAARREYHRWLEYERRWLRAYDGVWTVSEEDRSAAIREGSHPGRTFAVPNGVDTVRFTPSPDPGTTAEILYVGSFRHLPNMIGFEKLRDEVMPRVWSRCPNAVVRVVAGPDHVACWQRYAPGSRPLDADPRLTVHGFVEDLRPLYARASAVAVPLEVSAGTNIKVLEAMACGKAIVTTPAGCSGLDLGDGRDALIRHGWANFAGAISGILSDTGLRSHIARHARRTAEQRFSWAAIQEDAYYSYLQVSKAPQPVEQVSRWHRRSLRRLWS